MFKKSLAVVMAFLMLFSLCACEHTKIEKAEEITEETTAQVTEENLIEKLQGWWVGKISDGVGFLMNFNGENFVDGIYPGSYGVEGIVTQVTKVGTNEFEIQIHFPEGYIYENPIPAHDRAITVKSDDGFKEIVIVKDSDGSVYECHYAGITDEERLEKCQEITGY